MPRLFGEKLRDLRQRAGLTQAELARQLNIKPPHMNNLEAGRRAPSIELVLTIADVFGVLLDYLLRDDVPVGAVAEYKGPTRSPQSPEWKHLGRKLRALRLSRGLNQGEVAQQLGLASHSHISFVETDNIEPSLELVVKLAELFGVATDYLLRDEYPRE